MDLIKNFIDIFLHLDVHLSAVIQTYGVWTYLLLFLIIFCETGLVVIPFLPGDSLVFAAGAFAAIGQMNIGILYIMLCFAAILGDTVNYEIGKFLGPKVFEEHNIKFLKKEHLEKTQKFYEKHGGKTIILARFIPIIRTFAPFVAGVGKMKYKKFISFNFVGGISWITIFLFMGYFFGNIPSVKHNFTFVIIGIIFISILPGLIEYIRQKRITSSKNIKEKSIDCEAVDKEE